MYRKHYHLKLLPFENTPDARFLYTSEDHKEALAGIEYTIRMRKGLVMVSGEIGAGKTIITHVLKKRIGDAAHCILLRQGHTDPIEFLRYVCRSLQINVRPNADRGEMLELVEDVLVRYHSIGKPVVLIFDEAQMLSKPVLHEIRMISNIETETSKLIQMVLMGQPELQGVLQEPEMAPLRQRIALSHHLRGMSLQDTGKYIAHRLKVASGGRNSEIEFMQPAVHAIHQFTRGIPRLVNFVADNCLLVGYVKSVSIIDAGIVRHVTESMMIDNTVVGNYATPIRAAA